MACAGSASSMNDLVLKEEQKYPNWTISAEDRRQRELRRKACTAHYEDLAKYQKTKLRSLRLIDDKD